MSTPFEIAKKISFQQKKSNTTLIVKLSILATTLSVAAIILTLSIVNGFQQSIANKVFSFWGHIRIESVNGAPLQQNDSTIRLLLKNNLIQSISPFIIQSTVISYKKEIEGVAAKGVPISNYIPFIIAGRGLTKTSDSNKIEIVLSDLVAKKLKIKLNDPIRLYFLNDKSVKQRKFKVVGLYHSGIEDYDQQFVLIDIKVLQQLQGDMTAVQGYAVQLKNKDAIDPIKDTIQSKVPKNWVSTTIPNYYPQLFDWIGVQTMNRNVVITIMVLIAIVNLLTCLFILMLDRIPMIGTLTALGASHLFIRKIFIYQASFICWTGIGFGTFMGVGISLLQQYFGWIQLDESAYFIKTLPIQIIPWQIAVIVIGTALLSYASFLLPTIWIKKISPAKTLQFD